MNDFFFPNTPVIFLFSSCDSIFTLISNNLICIIILVAGIVGHRPKKLLFYQFIILKNKEKLRLFHKSYLNILFLACYITRLQNSGLELILQKWAHSLIEVDLAWSTATSPLDAAVFALAEKGSESKLRWVWRPLYVKKEDFSGFRSSN